MNRSRLFGGLIAVALTLTGCGEAGRSTWRDRPPKRFQGDASTTVVFTTEGEVQSRCPMPPPNVAVGCTSGGVIYVPNPCRWRDPYAVLLCHEIGHVSGWSGFHED